MKMLQKYYRKSSNRLGKLLSAIVIRDFGVHFHTSNNITFYSKKEKGFSFICIFFPNNKLLGNND